MSFKYYLFDLDNCILHFIDSTEYYDKLIADTLKNFIGYTPKRYKRKKAWNSPDINRYILQKWSIKKSNDFWLYYKTIDVIKRKELVDNGRIFLDSIALKIINKLREERKKTALITNSPRYVIQILDQNFSFNRLFDEVLSIDYNKDDSIVKPSPKGIEIILRKLCDSKIEICKSETILIGDSEIDIVAAKKAGIFSCLLINENNKKLEYDKWKVKPDFIIYNFYELLDL